MTVYRTRQEGSNWIRHEGDIWVLYSRDNRRIGESPTLDGIRTQQRLVEYLEGNEIVRKAFKKYVSHEGSKWTVRSHSGKQLGSYASKEEADKRLRQIEYFKHNKMSQAELATEVKDLAKAWFGEPERHAEAARHDGITAGPESNVDLHDGLKTAVKVAAITAIAAGGLAALKGRAVRGLLTVQAEKLLAAAPAGKVASKLATSTYEATAAGGHTVSLAGEIPKARYMVSPYKAQTKIIPFKDFNAGHVDDYVKQNKDLLGQANHHLGTWRDKDTDLVHLDVSLPHDNRLEALKIGQKHDQLAIYDGLSGKDIPVNAETIAQATFVEKIRDAYNFAPHSWGPHLSTDGGYGTDTLRELTQAVKRGQTPNPVRLLYNSKNGNFVVGPYTSSHELMHATTPGLTGELDRHWARMVYLPEQAATGKAGKIELWDWSTAVDEAKGTAARNYADTAESVMRNKAFTDETRFSIHEPFKSSGRLGGRPTTDSLEGTEHTLGEWRKLYGKSSKGMFTYDIDSLMKNAKPTKAEEATIPNRTAMAADEQAEHPTLPAPVIDQIVQDHLKVGKDILYKRGIEVAKKLVIKPLVIEPTAVGKAIRGLGERLKDTANAVSETLSLDVKEMPNRVRRMNRPRLGAAIQGVAHNFAQAPREAMESASRIGRAAFGKAFPKTDVKGTEKLPVKEEEQSKVDAEAIAEEKPVQTREESTKVEEKPTEAPASSKVNREVPTEEFAQPNTQESIEQVQSIDETLVALHSALVELEALASDQQMLSDDEMQVIILPLQEKVSLLLNALKGDILEESATETQNLEEVAPEDSTEETTDEEEPVEEGETEEVSADTKESTEEVADSEDPQRKRKKPQGPPRKPGTGTAERELTEPATDFTGKVTSNADLHKGFFGIGGDGRGWKGDPAGHAEAARERWAAQGVPVGGAQKPAGTRRTAQQPTVPPTAARRVSDTALILPKAVKDLAVKTAGRAGRSIARAAGDAIAEIGWQAFGTVAGLVVYRYLAGKSLNPAKLGAMGVQSLKRTLAASLKMSRVASTLKALKMEQTLRNFISSGSGAMKAAKVVTPVVAAAGKLAAGKVAAGTVYAAGKERAIKIAERLAGGAARVSSKAKKATLAAAKAAKVSQQFKPKV